MLTLDLFAGPGGWDLGAAELDILPVGIEIDRNACATRAAVGLPTIRADVATMPLSQVELWGLIASPPCTSFSYAGHSKGAMALDDVLRAVDAVAAGIELPRFDDPTTALVVEPLRYALHYQPTWCAWEQVSAVLPVWDACAVVLRESGYNVWTGILAADDYGVPQARKRAVLIASRERQVGPPPAIGVRRTMHEALGWHGLIGFPRRYDGKGTPVILNDVAYRGRDLFPTNRPAPTVTEKARSWSRWDDGQRLPVTRAELGVLQGFPFDYPWQGTGRSISQQIGDAIPPRLALHVLAEAIGVPLPPTRVEEPACPASCPRSPASVDSISDSSGRGSVSTAKSSSTRTAAASSTAVGPTSHDGTTSVPLAPGSASSTSTPTSSPAAFPARTSASPGSAPDSSTVSDPACSSRSSTSSLPSTPEPSSSRTSQDSLPATTAKTSPSLFKRWPTQGIRTSSGEFSTRSSTERPSDVVESSLLPSLVTHVDRQFWTTPSAAAGILSRSQGQLPEPLLTEMRAVQDGEPSPRLRRLTPTEWERLQGMPDGWSSLNAPAPRPVAPSPGPKVDPTAP